jgi:hypothetical protein
MDANSETRAYLLTISTLAAKLDATELENGTLKAKLERALAERDSALQARKVVSFLAPVPVRETPPAPAPAPAPAKVDYGLRMKKAGRDVHAGDSVTLAAGGEAKISSITCGADGEYVITIDPGGALSISEFYAATGEA